MFKSVFIVVGMCGIGLLVWRQLQRQEAGDESTEDVADESPERRPTDD